MFTVHNSKQTQKWCACSCSYSLFFFVLSLLCRLKFICFVGMACKMFSLLLYPLNVSFLDFHKNPIQKFFSTFSIPFAVRNPASSLSFFFFSTDFSSFFLHPILFSIFILSAFNCAEYNRFFAPNDGYT